jgi:hypothetical protein
MWTVDYLSSKREFIVAYFICVPVIKCEKKVCICEDLSSSNAVSGSSEKKWTVEDARPVLCLEPLGASLLVTRRQLTTWLRETKNSQKLKITGFVLSFGLSAV